MKARRGTAAQPSSVAAPERVESTVRIDRRTKDLPKRLSSGDIAVICHMDIDRVAAESLVDSGVAGVVNCGQSSSGRYPNEGPLVLLDAGIALVDGVTEDVMDLDIEGTVGEIDGSLVTLAGQQFDGIRQSRPLIEAIHAESRACLGAEFIRFVENTAEYMDDNVDLVSDDLEIPDVGIDFHDRHVLMVVRGHDYRDDLKLLRSSGYIRDQRPILIGVDGGADALMEMGMTPDVIVGDFDSVSAETLACGAHLVVHAYRDGNAPGAARLEDLGLPYVLFKASGTSEDIAMLMAYNQGAALIVAVGTHSSMVDFLDKGRSGMASTILTRMKVGSSLVDAKGVSRLYHSEVRKRDLLILVLGAVVAMAVIAFVSEPLRLIVHAIWSDLTG